MKNFRVTVNGKSYDVAVEELAAGAAAPAPVIPAAVAPSAPAPVAPSAPPAPSAAVSGSALKVAAPMPGTILDVRVAVGDVIQKNQVVAILEAMKMENEIVTPSAGKVVGIHTSKGSTVSSGDLLVSVEA